MTTNIKTVMTTGIYKKKHDNRHIQKNMTKDIYKKHDKRHIMYIPKADRPTGIKDTR